MFGGVSVPDDNTPLPAADLDLLAVSQPAMAGGQWVDKCTERPEPRAVDLEALFGKAEPAIELNGIFRHIARPIDRERSQ